MRADLRRMNKVFQQLRIVVGHFFEVGDEPAFVHGVAVETAGELVVDAALGHFFESGFGHGEEVFFTGLAIALQQADQPQKRGETSEICRIRRCVMSNSCVIELICAVHDAEIEFGTGAGERFGFGYRFGESFGSFQQIRAFLLVGIGDREEDAAKTGAAHLVFRWKIRAAEKRFAIGHQEAGERPAALSADGADGGLVAGVHVGAFVAIHFYGHKMFVDDFGDGGVFVAFAVDDVAPVAPDGADVEEDGFILGLARRGRRLRPIRASRWAGERRSGDRGWRNLSGGFRWSWLVIR